MKNKAVILFLLKFFVCYIIFSGLYQYYLSRNKEINFNKADYVTHQVALQSVFIGKTFGYEFKTEPTELEPSMKLILYDRFVARVVEGCNSVSVLILFWAFIIAFTGTWKDTIFFLVIGSFLIYLVNLFRIVFLTYALYRFPQWSEFLHKIAFPSIIYGFTFLIWVVWVKRVEQNQFKSGLSRR